MLCVDQIILLKLILVSSLHEQQIVGLELINFSLVTK